MEDKKTSINRLKSLVKLMQEYKITYMSVDGITLQADIQPSSGEVPTTIQNYGNDVGLFTTKRTNTPITAEVGDEPLEMTEEELLFYSAE